METNNNETKKTKGLVISLDLDMNKNLRHLVIDKDMPNMNAAIAYIIKLYFTSNPIKPTALHTPTHNVTTQPQI